MKSHSEAQRRAQTGNRSNAQSIYETITDEDFAINSRALYGLSQQKKSMPTTSTISNDQTRADEDFADLAYSLSQPNNTSMPTTNSTISKERLTIHTNAKLHVQAPPEKKMKIEVDGDSRKLVFTFY